ALMNPEDKKNIQDFASFSDRIEYIKIPYILDLHTETEIYRNIFGKHIDSAFLPMVLENFARVILSSRLNLRSRVLWEWIGNPEKYALVCDENLQLLKMEIYSGRIPPWLTEEDRKRFTAKRRRDIIGESEFEGIQGFSGRDAITIFSQFLSTYVKNQEQITMGTLYNFFTKYRKDLGDALPRGFMEALTRMYDYTVLQEVKESLYYYNEGQITRDIQNYIFATNFESGVTEICNYTGDKLHITDEYFEGMENYLLGSNTEHEARVGFRKEIQKQYTNTTLTREILMEGKSMGETRLFQDLHERYVRNLKEKVLEPFLENENFRRAIKDWGTENYRAYDSKIRNDVDFLIANLCKKFKYNRKGARTICMYVMDRNLAIAYPEI
ncbi:MAG: serine protein kinase PrkA, partial [Proteobacteria bacterium]|nr:serine protein kinase PrkA [Pseudomonadota bacterium]